VRGSACGGSESTPDAAVRPTAGCRGQPGPAPTRAPGRTAGRPTPQRPRPAPGDDDQGHAPAEAYPLGKQDASLKADFGVYTMDGRAAAPGPRRPRDRRAGVGDHEPRSRSCTSATPGQPRERTSSPPTGSSPTTTRDPRRLPAAGGVRAASLRRRHPHLSIPSRTPESSTRSSTPADAVDNNQYNEARFVIDTLDARR